MKKLITGILAFAMMLGIIALPGMGNVQTAKAAGVEFSVTPDPKEMLSTGGNVSFSFDITNNTGETITDAKIITPANKTITIGTIGAGDSPYVAPYTSKISTVPSPTFIFKLSYVDSGGVRKTVEADGVSIKLKETTPNLAFDRSVDTTVVKKGGSVYVTYKLENNSDDALTITSLKDNFSSSSIVSSLTLSRGQSKEVIKKYTVSKDVSSAPTVTYKYGSKTYTKTLSAVNIKVGSASLEVKTTADKTSGSNGDTVKFTTTIKNTGTEDLTGISLYDNDNNVVKTGISVSAGETQTVETEVTLSSDKDVYFTAKGKDSSGSDISFKSNTVSLSLSGPISSGLEVTVSADKESINAGDTITFTFNIKNTSSSAIKNVCVGEQDSEEPLTEDVISSLGAGESGTITASIGNVYEDTDFTFIAVGTTTSGKQVQVASNTISVKVDGATETPVATDGGFAIGNLGTLFTIFIVIIVLIIVSVIILLVLVSKEKKKKKLIAAQRSKQKLQQKKPGSNINGNNKPRR